MLYCFYHFLKQNNQTNIKQLCHFDTQVLSLIKADINIKIQQFIMTKWSIITFTFFIWPWNPACGLGQRDKNFAHNTMPDNVEHLLFNNPFVHVYVNDLQRTNAFSWHLGYDLCLWPRLEVACFMCATHHLIMVSPLCQVILWYRCLDKIWTFHHLLWPWHYIYWPGLCRYY
jgi:hypothetical protein